MIMDYGTITVFFQTGLSMEQKTVITQMAVENQLLTSSRKHYNDILNQCVGLLEIAENGPITVNWNLGEYRYTFKIQIIE